ncbi:T3SS effector HopA1 family protein [Acrocarpospora macrocephala]|nr:T3SS effector HopA1 family protein [Acrocarpospora macrocephala]
MEDLVSGGRRMIHPDIPRAGALLAGFPADKPDVEEALYSWYLAMTPLPVRVGGPTPVDVNLAGVLDAAHADATRFVGGWRVESVVGMGGVVACKGEFRRYLGRGAYVVPARPGLAAREGDALLARAAWTWCDAEHGFWYTRQGVWPPPGADRLMRTYLNVAPDDVPRAVEVLTGLLGKHRGVSYQLKTPLEHEGRADAIVLYLGAPDAVALDGELRAAVRELCDVLRPARPRFCAAIAPGVGQAEGSLDGDSFGAARCQVLERIWREMAPQARRDPTVVTQAIVNGFKAAGIDPIRPHLLEASP